MMVDYTPIYTALENDDKATARRLLRSILKQAPTAEAWYLAARAMEEKEKSIQCLRKALELDALHTQANRLLFQLEGAKSLSELERERAQSSPITEPLPPLPRKPRMTSTDRQSARRRARRRMWNIVAIIGAILLALASGWFLMFALGVGFVTDIMCTIDIGTCPLESIDGTPIDTLPDAVFYATPDVIRELESGSSMPTSDMLAHGFTHEYEFQARAGEEYAIMVQFASPNAMQVRRNVAILDSAGFDAGDACQGDPLFAGDTGVAFICGIYRTGTWKVRIFGREGESTGTYVVLLERLN